MEHMEHITRRVAVAETITASFFLAKARPDDMFAGVFFDIREKAKALKQKWEEEARNHVEKALISDLKGSGVPVLDLKVSLGQYRGSRFVTSAKLKVKVDSKAKAEKLLKYLQTKYSPKYKLKSFNEDSGEAEYNVR